ncbi:MAG TPA: hypothetical protein VE988_15420 [Gemmataceae bacterium]|nr:hypothetical protein [Gemmataceae bacterium]
MKARRLAAQFAARTWYEECRAGRQTPDETAQFARKNWQAFLPVAHVGLGKLLMQINGRQSVRRRNQQLQSTQLAEAS